MKKIFRVLIVVAAISVLFASCKSTQRCAAYGETYRYKTDRNF